MSTGWQKLDLEGGGLQAMNARLTARMRSRAWAYAAWVLFPLGLHRWYLAEPRGASAFAGLTAITVATAWLAPAAWWLVPLAALLGFAAFDLYWIDRRVVTYNKELRMKLFLRKGRKPPTDYRGRYTETTDAEQAHRDLADYQALKETERAGHTPSRSTASPAPAPGRSRVPSFNDQEAMLRHLRKKPRP